MSDLNCRIQVGGVDHETIDDWHLQTYRPDDLVALVGTLNGRRLDGFYTWRGLRRDLQSKQLYAVVMECSEAR